MVTPHPTAARGQLSIVDTWSLLVSRLKAATATITERYDERARIEKEINARIDEWCVNIFIQIYTNLEHLTSELEMQLAITKNLGQGQDQASSMLYTSIYNFVRFTESDYRKPIRSDLSIGGTSLYPLFLRQSSQN